MLTKQEQPAPLDERLALAMATAQSERLARRDPEWVAAGWPFLRAAAIEGARGLDRLDWKWWKREEGGCDSIAGALTAVWGHGLSHLIVERRGDLASVAKYLSWSSRHEAGPLRVGEGIRDPRGLDVPGRLELVVGMCAVGRFPLAVLADLFRACNVGWDALARKHLADCALAAFRLARGGNDCCPIALADGRDDREHLWEMAADWDPRDPSYCTRLRDALSARFAGKGVPT